MAGPVPEESGRKTCLLRQVSRQRSFSCAGVSVWMAGIVRGEVAGRNIMKIFVKNCLQKNVRETPSSFIGHVAGKSVILRLKRAEKGLKCRKTGVF